MPENKSSSLAGSGIQKLQDLAEFMYRSSAEDLGMGPSPLAMTYAGKSLKPFAQALRTSILDYTKWDKGEALSKLTPLDITQLYLGLRFPHIAKQGNVARAIKGELPGNTKAQAQYVKNIIVDPRKLEGLHDTISAVAHEATHVIDSSRSMKNISEPKFGPIGKLFGLKSMETRVGRSSPWDFVEKQYGGNYSHGLNNFDEYFNQPVEVNARNAGKSAAQDFMKFIEQLDPAQSAGPQSADAPTLDALSERLLRALNLK